MRIAGYEIDLDEAYEVIKKNGYERVGLQLPDGLKRWGRKIADEINASVVISAIPCHGACDIADRELKEIGIQLLIHIGHPEIPKFRGKYELPVIFIEALSIDGIDGAIQRSLEKLVGRVGLVANAQYVHRLLECASILEKEGFEWKIGRGNDRIAHDGQLLGCNYTSGLSIADEVDSYLYIGSGNFHPLGLALTTDKSVVAADPRQKKVEEMERLKEKILRQRWGAIEIARDAEKFGILISRKIGQRRVQLAKKLEEIIKAKGKKGYLLELDEFDPSYLNFGMDCYVSTACPRIAIDDYLMYDKPIITPIELEILLGKRDWNDYEFDQIL